MKAIKEITHYYKYENSFLIIRDDKWINIDSICDVYGLRLRRYFTEWIYNNNIDTGISSLCDEVPLDAWVQYNDKSIDMLLHYAIKKPKLRTFIEDTVTDIKIKYN